MSKHNPSQRFDLMALVFFLIRWWKRIAMVTFIGALISVVVALLLPPKFRAQAVIFPSSNGSFAGAYLSEITSKDKAQDPLAFGAEEDAEQMLQILQSDYVRNSVIRKFKLMEHYEIDPGSKGADLKLAKRYESNVSIKRNQYSAIEVTVMDRKPEYAANIANAVVAYADSAKKDMLMKYSEKAFTDMEQYMAEKNAFLDQIKDTLNMLGEKGIISPDEQVKGLMELSAVSASRNDRRALDYIDQKIRYIGSMSGDYFRYNRLLVEEAQKMADIRKKYEQAKINVASGIPSSFKVNVAHPPGDRAFPVRWLIVMAATIATFVTACVVFLMYEQLYLPVREQLRSGNAQ
jgi:uncharacterized protein involved in exopolysaccharide biosynthesis